VQLVVWNKSQKEFKTLESLFLWQLQSLMEKTAIIFYQMSGVQIFMNKRLYSSKKAVIFYLFLIPKSLKLKCTSHYVRIQLGVYTWVMYSQANTQKLRIFKIFYDYSPKKLLGCYFLVNKTKRKNLNMKIGIWIWKSQIKLLDMTMTINYWVQLKVHISICRLQFGLYLCAVKVPESFTGRRMYTTVYFGSNAVLLQNSLIPSNLVHQRRKCTLQKMSVKNILDLVILNLGNAYSMVDQCRLRMLHNSKACRPLSRY